MFMEKNISVILGNVKGSTTFAEGITSNATTNNAA